ncbi:MAG: LysM peptidoglycan-binding domain-containing protein [Thermomicrobiales bacterium]|nr:LysM peptidoglycan-binding domain-containing protein [Thermomicrobiales bacterium]
MIDGLRSSTRTHRHVALRAASAALWLALAAALGGCSGPDAPEPTVVPAPPLIVVTVTPGPKATPAPRIVGRYVVRPGDTLSGIASQFGISEEAIVNANHLSDRDRLYAGQELEIPAPSS